MVVGGFDGPDDTPAALAGTVTFLASLLTWAFSGELRIAVRRLRCCPFGTEWGWCWCGCAASDTCPSLASLSVRGEYGTERLPGADVREGIGCFVNVKASKPGGEGYATSGGSGVSSRGERWEWVDKGE